jgi:hypothetical protein
MYISALSFNLGVRWGWVVNATPRELCPRVRDQVQEAGCSTGSVGTGVKRKSDEICALLGFYVAYIGRLSQTFLDNLSVPYSTVKQTKKNAVVVLKRR